MSHEEQHGQDLTTGDLRKQLWSLSWPIMLSIFFYTLYNIVDTIWVGRISAEAIAAVSISQIALFAMVAFGMGITVGSGVLISMHIGAKQKDEAERVLGQSFVLSVLIGAFFTIIALCFKHTILIASGASGGVYDPAASYFTIVAAGSILMFVMMTIVFAFNAQGDSFTPTKLFAVSTGVNVILDPLLIFGWGPVPALGIAGAAYATLLSQAIFIAIALYTLSRPVQMIPFHLRNLTMRWHSVREVLKIGFPAALTQLLQPVGLSVLMFMVAQRFAELGTVAFSLAFRLEFFAYLPAIGFGFGSMAILGQNFGAKNFDRAADAYRLALKYGVVSAVVIGIIANLASKPLIAIFTTDPTVVADVTGYLLITGLTYGFLAASLIAINAFQAMGHSWSGFYLTFIRLLLITAPLTYFFTTIKQTSITGLWYALALGNIVAAIVGVIWVKYSLSRVQTKSELPSLEPETV